MKVFLVEDEFVIREGIKKRIDWEANGLEFCGEASDGEMALPLIQKNKPDILITDIKMPFMDGIALSRIVKKELPDTEIIVLSGYGEFEYAKDCINIGVSEYLLKPISSEALLKKILELSERIRERRRERASYEQYVREMEENFYKTKLVFFQDLISGEKSTAEILESAQKLDINLTGLYFCVLLYKNWVTQHQPGEYSKRINSADQKIEESLDRESVLLFDRNLEGKALLIKADSEEELREKTEGIVRGLKGILEEVRDMRYFIAIGKTVSRISGIPEAFESANRIFAHRYFVSDNAVMRPEEADRIRMTPENGIDINRIDPSQFDRERLLEFMRQGSRDEIRFFVEEFFCGLDNNAANSMMLKQYLIMDVYFGTVRMAEDLGVSREELEAPDVIGNSLGSMEEVQAYMTRALEKIMDIRDNISRNRYDAIIRSAISYLEEHYANPDLSLNMLAAYVNFSPNHLSAVFSQQTGRSFIKYLTDYRMNKAKELLRCTGARSSEICTSVGYKDPHYFSYLFKKTQGVTPTQYRENNLG